MYTLPLIALLVATACAGPVPQSTPATTPLAAAAEASTPMTDAAISTAGGIGGASGALSTSPRPSRRTLKPFSPLTLKPRTTPSTEHSGASRTPHTFKPFSPLMGRTTPAGQSGASQTPRAFTTASGASRTPFTLKPFSPRSRPTQRPIGGMGGLQSTTASSTPMTSMAPGAANEIERLAPITPETQDPVVSEAPRDPLTSKSPMENRAARSIWDAEWQLAESPSTLKAGIQDVATTPLKDALSGGISTTPLSDALVADVATTPLKDALSADVSTTPLSAAPSNILTPENRIAAGVSSTPFAPAAGISSTTFKQADPLAISTTPFNQFNGIAMSSTPSTTAANGIQVSTTPLTTLNPANPLNRIVRGIPLEAWMMEDTTTTPTSNDKQSLETNPAKAIMRRRRGLGDSEGWMLEDPMTSVEMAEVTTDSALLDATTPGSGETTSSIDDGNTSDWNDAPTDAIEGATTLEIDDAVTPEIDDAVTPEIDDAITPEIEDGTALDLTNENTDMAAAVTPTTNEMSTSSEFFKPSLDAVQSWA